MSQGLEGSDNRSDVHPSEIRPKAAAAMVKYALSLSLASTGRACTSSATWAPSAETLSDGRRFFSSSTLAEWGSVSMSAIAAGSWEEQRTEIHGRGSLNQAQ